MVCAWCLLRWVLQCVSQEVTRNDTQTDAIIAPIWRMIRTATAAGDTIMTSRDYHPHDHCSFAHTGGPFPSHCVQDTPGSKFLPEIADALAEAMKSKSVESVHVDFKVWECVRGCGVGVDVDVGVGMGVGVGVGVDVCGAWV